MSDVDPNTVAPEALKEMVKEEMLKGRSTEDCVKQLKKEGLEEQKAIDIVQQAEVEYDKFEASPEGKQHKAKQGVRAMIIGAVLIAAGIAITVVTYATADEGGTYYVLWGLAIIGAIEFVVGLVKWLRNKE